MTSTTAFPVPSPVGRGLTGGLLTASARFWFLLVVIGQWAFLYYIVVFYGPSTATGNFQAWTKNTLLQKGYVEGDTAGNLTFAVHALLAAVIAFGGALQLTPAIRNRFPAFHRWNGRIFMTTAIGLSLAGLYLVWVRSTNPTFLGSLSLTLNAALIVGCAVMAWAKARARDFDAHRRWAMRTFMVANAQWFIRVGFMAWVILNQGPVAMKAFNTVWQFGCYLVPLAILELYLRTQDRAGPTGRLAMAGGLFAATLVMAVGIAGFTYLSFRILSGQPLSFG